MFFLPSDGCVAILEEAAIPRTAFELGVSKIFIREPQHLFSLEVRNKKKKKKKREEEEKCKKQPKKANKQSKAYELGVSKIFNREPQHLFLLEERNRKR